MPTGVLQKTLDRFSTTFEIVDLTVGSPATSLIELDQCSTVRIDIVYDNAADIANDLDVLLGDASDGSDVTAIDSAADVDWAADTIADGGTVDTQLTTFEFTPNKPYMRVDFVGSGTGNAFVIIHQTNCRTNPPRETTRAGHKAWRLGTY